MLKKSYLTSVGAVRTLQTRINRRTGRARNSTIFSERAPRKGQATILAGGCFGLFWRTEKEKLILLNRAFKMIYRILVHVTDQECLLIFQALISEFHLWSKKGTKTYNIKEIWWLCQLFKLFFLLVFNFLLFLLIVMLIECLNMCNMFYILKLAEGKLRTLPLIYGL